MAKEGLYRADLAWEMALEAPPEAVFPLLCPVAERRWIPGWEAEVLHSRSGVAELDCVFLTPEEGPARVWLVTRYEPPARIQFAQWVPGAGVVRLDIELAPAGEGCAARWLYHASALVPGASAFTEAYGPEAFGARMARVEGHLKAHLAAQGVQGR